MLEVGLSWFWKFALGFVMGAESGGFDAASYLCLGNLVVVVVVFVCPFYHAARLLDIYLNNGAYLYFSSTTKSSSTLAIS